MFGGRFVGEAAHRRLVPGDEVDIPLIRGDGALHIVELKRAMSLKGPLVKRHRNSWVPAAQVHEAVGQGVNYLTGLDESRERLRADFGIETRRASALVLVGHPALHPQVPEEEINEALRTFNSHVTRVEVLTYKELLDNAERSLAGEGPV
ncbi:Shedu anti-phage system protein SduA domain-containing protein [Streptomyces sp. NPDC051172]|uniref:Shedu anti-phage system protein SduA domain-containing protein n=1 Tax=Streptomyces sp. NPDC051172 TaxID=3155796 RepID=UPI00343B0FCB